jgi:hypothetical protein
VETISADHHIVAAGIPAIRPQTFTRHPSLSLAPGCAPPLLII